MLVNKYSELYASNKNSLKLRLKSAENFSRGARQLKFSALMEIILEFPPLLVLSPTNDFSL